jgi:uncharacterized membrane protein YhaH (DUF805 family)
MLANEDGAMLGFLFGFNARIGRLHYFLCLFGLGFVTGLIAYIATGISFSSSNGIMQLLSFAKGGVAITLGIVFLFVSFTLQSMRFRDIGWDPVCVIPIWVAALIVDRLVATKFPAVSLGPESNQTIVGALVHFGLVLALLLWPSARDAEDFDEPRRRLDAPPRRDQASVAAQRMARISGGR